MVHNDVTNDVPNKVHNDVVDPSCPTEKSHELKAVSTDSHELNTSTLANGTIIEDDQNDWQTVHRKRSFSPSFVSYSDDSPTLLKTFKNLTKVDEIDAKRVNFVNLSKSQMKKRKKLQVFGD